MLLIDCYRRQVKSILSHTISSYQDPDSKVHGANMGPIWGRQDPDGPNVGSMDFAICGD